MINIETDNKKNELMTLPTCTASDTFLTIMGARGDLSTFRDRRNEINHASIVKAKETGKERKIELTSNEEKLMIYIEDVNIVFGSKLKERAAARKIFMLLMIEANKITIKPNDLSSYQFKFPLERLVELGIYSDIQNARRGFRQNMRIIRGVYFSGDVKTTGDWQEVSLFTSSGVKKGECIIGLNPEINWGKMLRQYTFLPQYYFGLSGKADMLLYVIFYLARMRSENLAHNGCFKIKYRTLQFRMNLPNEKEVANARRDIIDVIEAAVTEIEEHHAATYNNDFLQITPMGYTEKDRVAKCLDNGYLEITFKSEFLNPFLEFQRRKTRKIKQVQSRKEKIIDAAKARNLAKKMEEEEKQE